MKKTKKTLKVVVCVLVGVLAVCAIAGVAVALAKPNDTSTTDCLGDLHFFNDKFVCKNCKQQAPQSIGLSQYFVTTYFVEGDGCQLVCNFLPENSTLTKVAWSSSDEEVATVDENGYVTYKSDGVARIYATPLTGDEYKVFCTFTLTRRFTDLSLVFERDQYFVDTSYLESDMLRTDTVRIYDNGSAAMPEDGNFVWASSDESVVKVFEGAKRMRTICYVGEGSAIVTATASNGAVATARVYVGPRLKLSLDGYTSRVVSHIGATFNISCEWQPEKCIGDFVSKYTSSNTNVATVDNDGIVTIIGYGTVTFKADVYKSSTAVDTEFTIEVLSPDVTALELKNSDKGGVLVSDESYVGSFTMAANTPPADIADEYPNTVQLSAGIRPWYAEDKNVVWTSSNTAVATVDESGLVTAVGGGTATITATGHNGVSASCTVNSTLFVESVTLTGYETVDFVPSADFCRMFVGDSIQLDKQILPADNNDTRLNAAVWRSSSNSVATVDENGLVTAIGAGAVTIYYAPFYNVAIHYYFAMVKIVVCEAIEDISLDFNEMLLDYSAGRQRIDDNHYTLALDDSLTLVTRITGSNTETNGVKDRLHYSSSNNAVTVSSSGLIRAKRLGTSVITVTTDSGKSASITITVLFFAQGMSVNDLTMSVGDSVVLPLVLVPENATPYLGISYNSRFVEITSDYEFDNGYLYLGQQIIVTAKEVGTCTVTLDACGPFDASDPTTKASVTFTITINAARQNLEACSWEDIGNYSLSGQASQAFRVGDEKRVQLTTGEELTVVILGFNHDDMVDGCANSISFGLKGLMAETMSMEDLDLDAIFELLPLDLQGVIRTAVKRAMAGNRSEQIVCSQQKLWLFAEVEIDGTSRTGYCDEGSQYAYWSRCLDGTDKNDRVLTINYVAKDYWLRSPSTSATGSYSYVGSNGVVYASSKQTNSYGICFGFCV